jgi:uncharacterized protein DUF4410
MNKSPLTLATSALIVAGYALGITRPSADNAPAHLSADHQVASVSLSLTPEASLAILVKDMRVRSNFSAVIWGFMAGSDSVSADIVLRDPAGKELDRFEVSASYALGGQDDARMGWLYEKFAEETVQELTKP